MIVLINKKWNSLNTVVPKLRVSLGYFLSPSYSVFQTARVFMVNCNRISRVIQKPSIKLGAQSCDDGFVLKEIFPNPFYLIYRYIQSNIIIRL